LPIDIAFKAEIDEMDKNIKEVIEKKIPKDRPVTVFKI
jgi:hypothetical protein